MEKQKQNPFIVCTGLIVIGFVLSVAFEAAGKVGAERAEVMQEIIKARGPYKDEFGQATLQHGLPTTADVQGQTITWTMEDGKTLTFKWSGAFWESHGKDSP